jgi:lysophospholipase L1-like esterase
MKLILLTLLALTQLTQAQLTIKKDQRVLWLGDSVTAKGTHIGLIDGYLITQHPELNITNMPCGLSSETACGLSEPLHPWPRPNVHERLDRAIAKLEFEVAIVCYGVNDGIYYPFSEERFKAYHEGMTKLITKLKASGAKVIALTPAPFDAGSFPTNKLLPEGADEYGYTKVYQGYNEVMKRYAKWVMEESPADLKIDITNSLTEAIEKRRKADPSFRSGDGVHPNDETYAMLAEIILEGLGEKSASLGKVPAEKQKLALKKHHLLGTAYREHVGHKRPGGPKNPMPLKEALEKATALEKRIRG